MDNVIYADFSPQFRAQVVNTIKGFGIARTEVALETHGFHPSFRKAIIRSIIRKEGW